MQWPTAAAAELGLETLEVSLVLDNLNETLEITRKSSKTYHSELAMKKYVARNGIDDDQGSLNVQLIWVDFERSGWEFC